mmetsp:Transcript_602/g.1261  ORF Transcript_602/g.1261 Transcript_602/m.1261 type:complete len:585 (+) Transcript_602:208-1962(+)
MQRWQVQHCSKAVVNELEISRAAHLRGANGFSESEPVHSDATAENGKEAPALDGVPASTERVVLSRANAIDVRYKHITRGYRENYSWRQALASAFALHNETWNVWTHVIGAVLFAVLFLQVFYMAAPVHMSHSVDQLSSRLHRLKDVLSHASHSHCPDETSAVGCALATSAEGVEHLHVAFSKMKHSIEGMVGFDSPRDEAHAECARQGPAASACAEDDVAYAHGTSRLGAQLRARLGEAEAVGHAGLHSIGAMTARLLEAAPLRQTLPAAKEAIADELAEIATLPSKLVHAIAVALAELKEEIPRLQHAISQVARSNGDAPPRPRQPLTDGSDADMQRVEAMRQRLHALVAEVSSSVEALAPMLRDAASLDSISLERWPLYCFIASAVLCLVASAAYHLFATAMTGPVSYYLGMWDYTGIIALIVGSCVPIYYYGFYTSAVFRRLYLTVISLLGGALFVCTQLSFFYSAKWRLTRILLFALLGLVGAVPLVHLAFHHDFEAQTLAMLGQIGQMGLVYLAGTLIYATGFPEAFIPRRFDLFFASHQWWHVMVVVAALLHFRAVLNLYHMTSAGHAQAMNASMAA